MGTSLRHWVVPAYLALCLVLGGASAAGFWVNMALQLIAILIICWSVQVRRGTEMPRAAKQLLWIAALGVILVAIQLIPLPPSIWTHFPGRDVTARGFELLAIPLPWQPISLAPAQTLSSALWLLPALAVLLGIIRGGAFSPKGIAAAIILVTSAAVLIGALQVAGEAGWHFYEVTNFGSATGFFSNSNHMATLLLVCIPFLAALYAGAVRRGGALTQRTSAFLLILAGSLGVILVGLAINGSLAGMGLSLPVAFASVMLITSAKKKLPKSAAGAFLLLTGAAAYLVFTGPFGNNLVGENAHSAESRYESFRKSTEAAKDFMPLGSGFGTFADVYRTYEDPNDITRVYMNHVHNDYIEIALEGGLLGLLIIALFMLWWVTRTARIWRSEDADLFPKAATIASGAILAHSFVDYPLRTAAISAVLAACCGMMAGCRPAKGSGGARKVRDEVRHLSAD